MPVCSTGPVGACRRTVLLAAAAILAVPAGAQITFNPGLSLGRGYTDNVVYVETQQDSESSATTSLGLVAPLRLDSPRGSFGVTYDLDLTRYDERSEADNTAHSLRLDHRWKSRRGAALNVRSTYTRSEEQLASRLLSSEPGDPDTGDAFQTVTERTDRDVVTAALGYDWPVGKRWRLGAGVNGGITRVDGGSTVEDRDNYGASFRGKRATSPRTDAGWSYVFSHSESPTAGDNDFHNLQLTYDHDFTRRFNLGLRGGVLRVVPETGEDETRATVGLDLRFNDDLTLGPVRFDYTAGVSPSTVGAEIGNSLNTRLSASISGVTVYPWNWRVTASYLRRDPFDEQISAETETVSARAAVERRVGRTVGARLTTSWADQTSDDSQREASFYSAIISVVVYPLASKRISGGRAG